MRGFVRATALLSGLALYGFSMALMVRAGLGLDPWDVFHQGISRHTGWTIGTASAVVGVAVLLALLLNAVATVLYIGAGLGPGPRDGLMTGLVARTGRSVRLVRTAIEAAVLLAGWLLGGTVGVGTVVYAFGIGPLVQLILHCTPHRLLVVSGWGAVAAPAGVEVRDDQGRRLLVDG